MKEIRPRTLYAGLLVAIVVNVVVVVGAFTPGPLHGVMPAGNVAAIVVALAGTWLVRNRERFRR